MNILFISANRVGDAVLTTGLLSWLEQKYPDARFTIACGPYGADIFRATPRLERLIVMKKKKWNGHWFDLWKQCIGTRWDLIVDLRNTAISRLLCANKRVIHKKLEGAHKVVENAALLNLDPPPNPHIWIAPEAEKRADTLIPRGARLLAFGPAANWPHKQWPIEHFTTLMQALTQKGGALENASVMVIADKHERTQVAPLLDAIPAPRRIEIIGQDLQTAAACLKRANLYVGNDSGLMHLAAALGTPTLGLFGVGFPEIYGPWGKHGLALRTPETREELWARLAEQDPPKIPLMQNLTTDDALKGALKLLAEVSVDQKASQDRPF